MKKTHLDWLWANNACRVGLAWVKEYDIKSLEEAWTSCDKGEWLLWMAQRLGIDKCKLTICAALSAHTVVQYMEDERSREAVRVAFLWGRGKATEKELDAAWSKAHRAFFDASGDEAAIWAARLALSVVSAANNDNIRKHTAAAAAAASWTISAAAGDVSANQLRTAAIARKMLTEDVMEKIKEIK